MTAEAFDVRDAGDRVVTVRDGKILETVVYPTVDEALAAAAFDG